ncbi:unnamed protein product [Orchesella dallaii]|uniref:L-xylulose reductase n=1 Tax=Orchesella dallaii TaxID=48710 RepID=A0ABP1RE32_9HEXA
MSLSISFEGKRILVTGAARGLGREIVEELAKQGAIVFALGRNAEYLAKLKADFPTVNIVCVDLANWQATRDAVEGLGEIDYLINNAGIVHVEPILNCSKEHFDEQFNVNVKAAVNVSQVVAKKMIEKGNGGCIINVSSLGAKVAAQMLGVYDCTKASLDMLTKSMALELGQYNIRVNSVNPTVFASNMTKTFLENNPGGGEQYNDRTPLKRLAQSSEIINSILFLMSDNAAMINGTTLLIDGGYAAN